MGNRSESYHEYLIDSLQDPKLREAYVNAALEDGDHKILLAVLEDCAEAMGGITRLAKQKHVAPRTVYKMFSDKLNPSVKNIIKILGILDFRICVSIRKEKVRALKAFKTKK